MQGQLLLRQKAKFLLGISAWHEKTAVCWMQLVQGFSHMRDVHEVVPPSTQKMLLGQHPGEDLALGVGTDPWASQFPMEKPQSPLSPSQEVAWQRVGSQITSSNTF